MLTLMLWASHLTFLVSSIVFCCWCFLLFFCLVLSVVCVFLVMFPEVLDFDYVDVITIQMKTDVAVNHQGKDYKIEREGTI